MIHHDRPQLRVTSLLRFYKEPTTDPFAPYDAICTLAWEDSGVRIEGFHGELSRQLLRELVNFLVFREVMTIRADRADWRKLPLGRVLGTETEIQVSDLVARFGASPSNHLEIDL